MSAYVASGRKLSEPERALLGYLRQPQFSEGTALSAAMRKRSNGRWTWELCGIAAPTLYSTRRECMGRLCAYVEMLRGIESHWQWEATISEQGIEKLLRCCRVALDEARRSGDADEIERLPSVIADLESRMEASR